jgi:hypothetical protein
MIKSYSLSEFVLFCPDDIFDVIGQTFNSVLPFMSLRVIDFAFADESNMAILPYHTGIILIGSGAPIFPSICPFLVIVVVSIDTIGDKPTAIQAILFLKKFQSPLLLRHE